MPVKIARGQNIHVENHDDWGDFTREFIAVSFTPSAKANLSAASGGIHLNGQLKDGNYRVTSVLFPRADGKSSEYVVLTDQLHIPDINIPMTGRGKDATLDLNEKSLNALSQAIEAAYPKAHAKGGTLYTEPPKDDKMKQAKAEQSVLKSAGMGNAVDYGSGRIGGVLTGDAGVSTASVSVLPDKVPRR